MCPGEIREITIPPILGYGMAGSRLFKVPGKTPLVWRIELVSVNFVTEEQNDVPRKDRYEGSGLLPTY
jgi:hypothetical protein